MLRLIALRVIYNTGEALYRDRSRIVELLLHLENKQIMPKHGDIQHNHMSS